MIQLKQQATYLDSDIETPVSLFLNKIGLKPGVLLESAAVDGKWGRYSLIAGNFLLLLSVKDGKTKIEFKDPIFNPLKDYEKLPFLEALRKILATLQIKPQDDTSFPPITRALYGYLGYGIAGLLKSELKEDLAKNEACLALPSELYLFDHTYNKLNKIKLFSSSGESLQEIIFESPKIDPEAKISEANFLDTPEDYISKVNYLKKIIDDGNLIQAVLSTGFQADFKGDIFQLYRILRRLNPSSYMFFLRIPNFGMAISSPEAMMSCQNNKLRLSPIAGSRPRGVNSLEDVLFEEELVSDSKEQAEHIMLVDLGLNDLGQIAEPGTLKVEKFMEVQRFSHIMHLTSYLGAKLKKGLDCIDALTAAFPAGTLSGAPKIKAMKTLAEVENFSRGPYGGSIGWIGLDKEDVNFDMGITIRGIWHTNDRLEWRAGAGIVADSEANKEWQECLNKSAVIRKTIEEFNQLKEVNNVSFN